MTAMTEIAQVGAAAPWSGVWLEEWFAHHGFTGIPARDTAPAVLAACVGAEFDSWCETNAVTTRTQTLARARAARQLPVGASCDGLRTAARDVAAWHRLRTGQLHLAS